MDLNFPFQRNGKFYKEEKNKHLIAIQGRDRDTVFL